MATEILSSGRRKEPESEAGECKLNFKNAESGQLSPAS